MPEIIIEVHVSGDDGDKVSLAAEHILENLCSQRRLRQDEDIVIEWYLKSKGNC